MPKRPVLSEYAASIATAGDAKAEGTPVLVYFLVREGMGGKGKQAEALKKIAKQCTAVESKCFKGRDSKVGILSKLFVCTEMDITSVMPKDNRCINVTKAPLVLLVSADGEKKITLSGKRITGSSLLSAMTGILKASGCDASKVLGRTKRVLSQVKKLEDKKGVKSSGVSAADKMLASAKKMMTKSEGKNKNKALARVKKAELKKKAAEAELEKAAKVLAPVYDELDKILEDSKAKIKDALDASSKS